MIKVFLFFIFLITTQILFSQNTRPNENSEGKKISFKHSSGNLEDILIKLSDESGINISFIHEKIAHITVVAGDYSNQSIPYILDHLLFNTGLEWSEMNGVYLIKISPAKTEIKSETQEAKSDTLILNQEKKYFLSITAGLLYNKVKFMDAASGNSTLLKDHSASPRLSCSISIAGGIQKKWLLLESGLQLAVLENEEDWSITKILPVGNGHKTKQVLFHYHAINRYTLLTVPLKLLYIKSMKSITVGAGGFIGGSYTATYNSDPFRYQDAYYYFTGKSDYNGKVKRFSISGGIELRGCYNFNNHYSISSSLQYQRYFSPIEINSFYKVFPANFSIRLSIAHYF